MVKKLPSSPAKTFAKAPEKRSKKEKEYKMEYKKKQTECNWTKEDKEDKNLQMAIEWVKQRLQQEPRRRLCRQPRVYVYA